MQQEDQTEQTMFAVSALKLKSKKAPAHWAPASFFTCPYHLDKTPSLSINFPKGIWRCFSCRRSGHISELYRDILDRSLHEDLGISTDAFSSLSRKVFYKPEEPDYSKLPKIPRFEIRGVEIPVEDSPEAKRYIRLRGFSLDRCQKAGAYFIKECTINGLYYSNRLCIPVYEQGVLINIELRDTTGEHEHKVLYPRDSIASTLYEWESLNPNEPVFIAEGLMDLFVLREDPYFANSTSIFGAAINPRQLWILSQFPDIIVIPDNDRAGADSVKELRDKLTRPFRILDVPRSIKDVGDVPRKLRMSIEDLRKRGWGSTMRLSSSLIFF